MREGLPVHRPGSWLRCGLQLFELSDRSRGTGQGSPLLFLVFRARYGWLLTGGGVLAADLFGRGRFRAALWTLVSTLGLSLVVAKAVDVPAWRALETADG